MGKILSSPVKRWPGTVTISDPLTYPQFLAVQDAVNEVSGLMGNGDKLTQERIHYIYLPGLIGCVEEWRIDGFPENVTAETFPSTPGLVSAEMITWLLSEIIALYGEAESVPNE